MLEETHYYPDGLIMAGISDKAWNKLQNSYHYHGNEIQNQEWNDGSGLEEDDFNARFYDPQLGRWNTQDPAGQYASPYLGMGNNWMNGTDPDGVSFWSTLADIGAFIGTGGIGYIGASLESTGRMFSDVSDWNHNWYKGAITADLIAGSALVGGEDIFAPAALTGSLGAAGANIAVGAAIGVGQNVASTLVQDGGKWDWNDQFSASVSGAISGAFQSGAMQNGFDSWTSNGAWSWTASPNVTGSLSGVTSDIAGSILSTAVTSANDRGWRGIFDITDQFSGAISVAAGQVVHNEAGSLWSGNELTPKQTFDKNIISNSLSALTQPAFSNIVGSINSLKYATPFDGAFSFNTLFGAVAGWVNDQYMNWPPTVAH
jgi:RHS repeat-associated protein